MNVRRSSLRLAGLILILAIALGTRAGATRQPPPHCFHFPKSGCVVCDDGFCATLECGDYFEVTCSLPWL